MNTRKFSKRQEKQVAKEINGKVQPNSGATPFYKGDVVTKHFLTDCKTSVENKKSYSVKFEDIEKLKKERFGSGKQYEALVFNFGPDTENLYVVTKRTMLDFIKFLEGEENE